MSNATSLGSLSLYREMGFYRPTQILWNQGEVELPGVAKTRDQGSEDQGDRILWHILGAAGLLWAQLRG